MRAFVALISLLAAASIAAADSRGAAAPNVTGTVVRSTRAATCYPGEPCDQPPQAAFLVFTRNGQSTRVRIGAHGAFAIRLARGLYRVSVLPNFGSTIAPATIRVPRGGVIHPRFVQRTR